MKKIDDETWEKLTQKTIIQVINENDLFVYKAAEKSYLLKCEQIKKEKLKEEIQNIVFPDTKTGFLRNIYIMQDEDFVPIYEEITEKLEERLYYATKYINDDFKKYSNNEVTQFLLELTDELFVLINEKIEEKTKKYVLDIL